MPYKFSDGKILDDPICAICKNVNGELYRWPDGKIMHWRCIKRQQDEEAFAKKYSWLDGSTLDMLLYEYVEETDPMEKALACKYVAIWSTSENEASIKGFDSLEEAKQAIEITENEDSGWKLHALYHNGKEMKVKFNTLVVTEDV
jgi:hypothetical protein